MRGSGMVLEHVLKAAGNDLSRESILRQALSIKDLELPMLLPGIKINTGESDHLPVEQLQFMRFTGSSASGSARCSRPSSASISNRMLAG
nr:hypothetical protein [Bradyrhizobium frederickii]